MIDRDSALKDYETAARMLKIQLQSLEVRGPDPDFGAAFQAAAKGRVSAIITITDALLNRYPKRIADLAIKNHLPSMYERSEYVEVGAQGLWRVRQAVSQTSGGPSHEPEVRAV
jgi:hypothetical protein